MRTVQYWKINSSSSTDSSSVTGGLRDEHGEKVARVDLRLPSDFYIGTQNLRGVQDIKVQLSQVKLSLDMIPVDSIPIDRTSSIETLNTKGVMTLWPWIPVQSDDEHIFIYEFQNPENSPFKTHVNRIMNIPKYFLGDNQETVSKQITMYKGNGDYEFRSYEQVLEWFSYNFNRCAESMTGSTYNGMEMSIDNGHIRIGMSTKELGIQDGITTGMALFLPFNHSAPSLENVLIFGTTSGYLLKTATVTGYTSHGILCFPFSIVVNHTVRKIFSFLPWIEVKNSHLSTAQQISNWQTDNFGDERFYILDTYSCLFKKSREIPHFTARPSAIDEQYIGARGVYWRYDYIFQNSEVRMTRDIESIIITVNGLNLSRQIQPVNIRQIQGSSLTTTIPIIEKFFIDRGMQGDLIYSHETFDDCSLASISVKDLHERNLTFDAWYICSDGTMHRVIIGDTGVFSIQLTLGIYF